MSTEHHERKGLVLPHDLSTHLFVWVGGCALAQCVMALSTVVSLYLQTIPDAAKESRLVGLLAPFTVVGIAHLLLLRRRGALDGTWWIAFTVGSAFAGVVVLGSIMAGLEETAPSVAGSSTLFAVNLSTLVAVGQCWVLRKTFTGMSVWIGASAVAAFVAPLANYVWPTAGAGGSVSTAIVFGTAGGAVKGLVFGVATLFMKPKVAAQALRPIEPGAD